MVRPPGPRAPAGPGPAGRVGTACRAIKWVAPSARQASCFACEAVARTTLATPRQSWSAAVPTPLPAAWITTTCPGCSAPSVIRLSQEVRNASGMAAASSKERFSGIRIAWAAGARAFSAYPPPASSAITRSPRRYGPAACSTSPATSSPMIPGSPAGGGDRLVGRTRYCDGPQPVAVIGGTKDVDVEAVARLLPDLILGNQEENSRSHLEELARLGLPLFVAFPRTVAEGLSHLARLGKILDSGGRDLVRRGYTALREAEAALERRRPLRAFVPIWMDPLMTVNGQTYM